MAPPPLFGSGFGALAGNRQFPLASDQRTWALFGEAVLPVRDVAEVQLAARHERYDKAGSTTDPKVSAQVFVREWLSFRGSWGTSFQAPSVLQMAGNVTTTTIDDAFDADGRCSVVDGAIVRPGINNNVLSVVNGGSLGPQQARNFNVGALFESDRAWRVSIDYWTFDYRDVIAQDSSFQAIVDDDCLDDRQANDPRVVRTTSSQITRVEADLINVGRVRTAGLDVHAGFSRPTDAGRLALDAGATLVTRFDVDESGAGLVDQLGSRNHRNGFSPTPELRVNVGLTWTRGGQTASVAARYISPYENDQSSPTTPPEIDAWTTFDVYYAYSFRPFDADADVLVALGANNLTDEDPPGLPTLRPGVQAFNQRPGYDGFVHDIRGRQTYLRLKVIL